MTGEKEISDRALEALFSETGEQESALSDDLQARILADSDAVQAGFLATEPVSNEMVLPLSVFFRAIGGWGGVGGLAVASAAGVWIGFANPSVVSPDLTTDAFDIATEDGFGALLPGDALFFEEG